MAKCKSCSKKRKNSRRNINGLGGFDLSQTGLMDSGTLIVGALAGRAVANLIVSKVWADKPMMTNGALAVLGVVGATSDNAYAKAFSVGLGATGAMNVLRNVAKVDESSALYRAMQGIGEVDNDQVAGIEDYYDFAEPTATTREPVNGLQDSTMI